MLPGVIPWLLLAVVAVPLVVIGYVAARRRSATSMPTDDPELEREFAAAEAYEAEWHEKDVERFHDERMP